jgi:hypothetical protein
MNINVQQIRNYIFFIFNQTKLKNENNNRSQIHFADEVYIVKDDNTQQIVVLYFYLQDIKHYTWNPTQQLYQIHVSKKKNNKKLKIINLAKINAQDTGHIIPQMTDIWFNPFCRSRNRKIQQHNWKLYKRDWSVKWSDIPYLRS